MKKSKEFDDILDECLERVLTRVETIEQCLAVLSRKGKLILSGLCPEDKTISISPSRLTMDEIIIKGTFLNPFSFATAVDQISTIVRKPLITSCYPLDDIKKAMEEAEKGNQIKIIIKPNKEG